VAGRSRQPAAASGNPPTRPIERFQPQVLRRLRVIPYTAIASSRWYTKTARLSFDGKRYCVPQRYIGRRPDDQSRRDLGDDLRPGRRSARTVAYNRELFRACTSEGRGYSPTMRMRIFVCCRCTEADELPYIRRADVYTGGRKGANKSCVPSISMNCLFRCSNSFLTLSRRVRQ
jgi:hypothetical protein